MMRNSSGSYSKRRKADGLQSVSLRDVRGVHSVHVTLAEAFPVPLAIHVIFLKKRILDHRCPVSSS
jgi:hypothetical protein